MSDRHEEPHVTEDDLQEEMPELQFVRYEVDGDVAIVTVDRQQALNSLNEDHIEFLTEIGLADLGDRRIGDMDEGGLNVQILSAHTPSVQNVTGQEGIDFAYRLNRQLVEGPMASYPGRFQAFATLPLQSPEAAADELERSVREDGFLGALTNGHIRNKFLDHPDFEPVLARAEALDVPIYLHPGYPPDEIYQTYFSTTRSEYKSEYQDYIFSGSHWTVSRCRTCVRCVGKPEAKPA